MTISFQINGRATIPVRAIPIASKWTFSPDVIAHTFARNNDGHDWRLKGVSAYFLNADGGIMRLEADAWEPICINLESLSARLPKKAAGRSEWRNASIDALPAGVFVWLDEFDNFYSKDAQNSLYLEDERPDAKITWPFTSYFEIHRTEYKLLIRPNLTVIHAAYFTRTSWKNFFTRSGDFSNTCMCSVAAAFNLALVRTGTFV